MDDDREQQRRAAVERLHILDGILTGMDAPHELLDLLLAAPDPDAARAEIRERWGLSDLQARALLDAQVRRFTVTALEGIRQQRAETLEWLDQLDRESD